MAYYYNSFPVGPNTGVGQAMMLGQQMAQGQYLQGQQGFGGAMANWAPSSLYTSPGSSGGGYVAPGQANPYNVPAQYQQSLNEAKAANLERYQQGLSGFQDRSNNMIGAQQQQTKDILTGYQNQFDRNKAYLVGQGESQKKDISKAYDNKEKEVRQDWTGHGLTASTLTAPLATGFTSAENEDLMNLNEMLNKQWMGYDQQISTNALNAQERLYSQANQIYGDTTAGTLGFLERRSDVGPDLNQLAELAQQYGAGGGGGGIPAMSGVPIYQSPSELGYQVPGAMPIQQQGMLGPPQQMNPLQQMMLAQQVERNGGGGTMFNPAMPNVRGSRFNPSLPSNPMEFNGTGTVGGSAPGEAPLTAEDLWAMGIDPETFMPVWNTPTPTASSVQPGYDAYGNPSWNPSAFGGEGEAPPDGAAALFNPNAVTPQELAQWMQQFGPQTVGLAQQVTQFLGHVPQTPQEAQWALSQMGAMA